MVEGGKLMKESVKKGLNKIVIGAAKRGANNASVWFYYQPKEPKSLKKLRGK